MRCFTEMSTLNFSLKYENDCPFVDAFKKTNDLLVFLSIMFIVNRNKSSRYTIYKEVQVAYLFHTSPQITFKCQKQTPRDVLSKRYSENMHKIYRRTPMPKCDLNKAALHP